MPIFKEKSTMVTENRFGGNGSVVTTHVLDEELYNGQIKLYSMTTLKPGCSIGFHKHEGNTETYFILTGKGEYNDNGTITEVAANDTTFTADGEGHGLANIGTEDLVFMALIVNNPK